MIAMEMETISVKVPAFLKRAFETDCIRNQTNQTEMIRRMLETYLEVTYQIVANGDSYAEPVSFNTQKQAEAIFDQSENVTLQVTIDMPNYRDVEIIATKN